MDEVTEQVNGHEEFIRDIQENWRRRELDCPFGKDIQGFKDNLLTAEALKEFVREQENKKAREQELQDNRTKWIIGAIGVGFTIVTILVNVILYYLEQQGG